MTTDTDREPLPVPSPGEARVVTSLCSGDVEGFLAGCSPRVEIHDPLVGRVRGEGAVRRFVGDFHNWLSVGDALVKFASTSSGRVQHVEEVDVELQLGTGRPTMPLAAVLEHDRDDRVSEMRLYYSTYFRGARRDGRTPVLPVSSDVAPRGPVATYLHALARGDAQQMTSLFSADAYVKEPLGEIFRGISQVAEWHRQFAEGDGAGMPLNICSVTDDGRTCAVEYMADRWGETVFPAPIGGLVVLVRDGGFLTSVRVYEEAEPEAPSGATGV